MAGATGNRGPAGPRGDDGKPGPGGKDGVGPDEKVRVSADDPKAGFLTDKLTAGNGIEIRTTSGKGGERLVIDARPQLSGGGGGGPTGVVVYQDGVGVAFGNKVSFDGGDPVTISNGIIRVPVGSTGGGGAVDSVNGQTGVVVLDAEDVGAVPGPQVVYVQPTEPADTTPGVLWNDNTLTGPPYTLQVYDADDAMWLDMLAGYFAPFGVTIATAAGDGLALGSGFSVTAADGSGVTIAAGGDGAGSYGGQIAADTGSVLGGGGQSLAGGVGAAGLPGGAGTIGGGTGNGVGVSEAAYFEADGGKGNGDPGRVKIYTDAYYGDDIDVLLSDDDEHAIWGPLTAAHIPDLSASYQPLDSDLTAFAGSSPETYTETNVTPDRSYDATASTLDEVMAVLGTLIGDLRSRGVLA